HGDQIHRTPPRVKQSRRDEVWKFRKSSHPSRRSEFRVILPAPRWRSSVPEPAPRRGEHRSMTHHELLEALGATPDRVESLAHGLSATRLTRRPREGEWSMVEVLSHLLVGERDVIFPRLPRMLLEAAPTSPASATSRTAFA